MSFSHRQGSSAEEFPPSEDRDMFRDHEPERRLLAARNAFTVYLKQEPTGGRFVCLTNRDAPLRRQDSNIGITTKRRSTIQENYLWNGRKGVWTLQNGGTILLESEIFNTILSYRRAMPNHARDAIYDYMKDRVEGVLLRDVKEAFNLWREYRLGELDAEDVELWGQSAASLGEHPPQSSFLESLELTLSDDDVDTLETELDRDLDPEIYHEAKSEPASDSEYAPEVNNPRSPNNTQQPTVSTHRYTFHPHKPHTLLVGNSKSEGNKVWLSLTPLLDRPSYRSKFYNHRDNVRKEEELRLEWFEEFKYSKFPYSSNDPFDQKRKQRQHIYNIIRRHEGGRTRQDSESYRTSNDSGDFRRIGSLVSSDTPSSSASNPGLNLNIGGGKRRWTSSTQRLAVCVPKVRLSSEDDVSVGQPESVKRLRRDGGPAITEEDRRRTSIGDRKDPTSNIFCPLQAHILAGTILRVSLSNLPGDFAPVNVRLSKCPTLKQFFDYLEKLFETLADRCGLQGNGGSKIYCVSASYSWDKELADFIRRDEPDDWACMISNIQKAWSTSRELFDKEKCKVEIKVHA